MTFKQRKSVVILISLVVILLASGCSILPKDAKSQSEVLVMNGSTEKIDADELASQIEDFKALKPSLMRLVKLESDLSFLIDEMSRYNEDNPIIFEEQQLGSIELGKNTAASNVIYKADGSKQESIVFDDDDWAIEAQELKDKWSDKPEELSKSWEKSQIDIETLSKSGADITSGIAKESKATDKAPDYSTEPLSSPKWDTTNGVVNTSWDNRATVNKDLRLSNKNQVRLAGDEENVNEQKFTSLGVMNKHSVEVGSANPIMDTDQEFSREIQNMKTHTIVGQTISSDGNAFDLNKFSDTEKLLPSSVNVNSCNNSTVNLSKGYGLHLASYKSLTNAKLGWQLLSKRHADTFCDASAKLTKVVVNGVEYLSLRVGGYTSKDQANKLCAKLREQGAYCQVATFSGETLL